MNKADLYAKYSKYTDTNKMVDEIMQLFKTYGHKCTEHGVCAMLDEFFINKKNLIELFAKSPHYAGELRIRLPKELKRFNKANDVSQFCYSFIHNIHAREIIIKDKDSEGKTMHDYIKTGRKRIMASQFSNNESWVAERNSHISLFTDDGHLRTSVTDYKNFERLIANFARNHQTLLNFTTTQCSNEINPNLKLRVGQKTSRAFNKVCEAYGLHNASINVVERTDAETGEIRKSNLYHHLYAQYSDMVSDLSRNVDFIISLNPYDYLTMSFGVNWASCHSIDKKNLRNVAGNYHGQYCSGTVSYMLDNVSIITYVLDRGGDVHDGKIYRNMFHYDERGYLIQGRVYPQGNDGLTDLYTIFREFVQEEISSLIGCDNHWTHLGGKYEIGQNVQSFGTHYVDYIYNKECNISSWAGNDLSTLRGCLINIGHTPMCIVCGRTHNNGNVLSHGYCS